MNKKVKDVQKGYVTKDGAGVNLVRVLSNKTTEVYDPILMLDSFDSKNYEDYKAGFPLHPHRGIETITYVAKGAISHKDSMGNSDTINDGEVQWMSAGSGILHEEMFPESEWMLGVQLWLNLAKKDKMTSPKYHSIKNDKIKEIEEDGVKIRLLSGRYKEYEGYKPEYLPLNYYDIIMNPHSKIEIKTQNDDSIMLFTLLGKIDVEDFHIEEKTAAKLTQGDNVILENKTDQTNRVLFISSKSLNEDIAWGGPIVMNTKEELNEAFTELQNGNFLKEKMDYCDK